MSNGQMILFFFSQIKIWPFIYMFCMLLCPYSRNATLIYKITLVFWIGKLRPCHEGFEREFSLEKTAIDSVIL